jgi:3-oxoacid CoA-transferase subunit B
MTKHDNIAQGWSRDQMAARAAQELRDGYYVNLGIGIPTLVANHVPAGINVTLQSRKRHAGHGALSPTEDEDRRRPDQRRQADHQRTAAFSLFRQRASFAMIRGGKIDLTVLGAMEVAENGDIANWMIPGKMVKGMGGAMDLVAGVKKIIVLMEHCAKDGSPKFIPACTLPLTGRNVVDMIITDLFSHCRDVVVAVSKAGGFGVLGATRFTPEQLEEELAWIDEHIDGAPYGVDVLVPEIVDPRVAEFADNAERAAAISAEHRNFTAGLLSEYGSQPQPRTWCAMRAAPGSRPKTAMP